MKLTHKEEREIKTMLEVFPQKSIALQIPKSEKIYKIGKYYMLTAYTGSELNNAVQNYFSLKISIIYNNQTIC